MKLPFAAAVLSLLVAAPAIADDYVKLPKLDKKQTNLRIKFVEYTGGTNGEMVVDIKNKGTSDEMFIADGLFFVPDGDPEEAPQRLGAAGPFKHKKAKGWANAEKLKLRPGETRRLKLQVFCIDSHRSSPQASQGFSIARKRMPKKLRTKIKSGAKKILRTNKGSMRKSKSSIQSHVWESRDGDWIKLEGERKMEKAPKSKRIRRNRHRMRKAPRQQRID